VRFKGGDGGWVGEGKRDWGLSGVGQLVGDRGGIGPSKCRQRDGVVADLLTV
jgi:hypothetical protein